MHISDVERAIAAYSEGPLRQIYIRRIRHLTGLDIDTAESIYQDVLLSAWKLRGQVEGDSFKPYFDQIVRRTAVHARKAERSRKELEIWSHDVEDFKWEHPGMPVLTEQVMSYIPDEEDRDILWQWSTGGRGTMPDPQRSHRIRAELREKFCE